MASVADSHTSIHTHTDFPDKSNIKKSDRWAHTWFKNNSAIVTEYEKTTVPLNYNFIFTRVHTRGATQYLACQMPKFLVEIQISTRRYVALPRDETWHVAFTRDGIMTFTCNVVVLTKLNNRQDSSCL